MFLSEKDLNSMELDLLTKPTTTTTTLEFDQGDNHDCNIIAPLLLLQEDEEKENDKCNISLKIKLPSPLEGEFIKIVEEVKEDDDGFKTPTGKELIKKVKENDDDDDDDYAGFKTPTCLDQKIPVAPLKCPPAPRKPKSLPLKTKRKVPTAGVQRRVVLQDLSNEIDALFPPVIRADLGNKIKKVRQEPQKPK